LSRFDLTVGYIPGKENDIADILSRWAYPASQAFRDISVHGNINDVEEAEKILRQEKIDEKDCMAVVLRKLPKPARESKEKTLCNASCSDPENSENSQTLESQNVEEQMQVQPIVKKATKFSLGKKKGLGGQRKPK
jgi:hypothetical protein